MIVRTQERQMRIIQACLMEVQNRHTDAQPGTQPTDTLPDVRLPTKVIDLGSQDLGKAPESAPTVFKHPKNVPRLENFPAWQWQ